MSPMLLNLGLIPIPPVPGYVKPVFVKQPKPPKANKSRGPRNAGVIAMHTLNASRRLDDLAAAAKYIEQMCQVSIHLLAARFGWSHSKAEDIMQVLKQRGTVKKIGAGKAVVWGLA